MSDEALDRFRAFLATRSTTGATERDLLLHEMGATINRHRLTGREEGMHAFNTTQLCELVLGQRAWSRDQPFVTGLMLSALVDGEFEIYDKAKSEGLLPTTWTWSAWAEGFAGEEGDLRRLMGSIPAVRERCGAACLAVRGNPAVVGSALLGDFCNVHMAKVYHRLLRVGLAGPRGSEIADHELSRLAGCLEVLFAEDTDATLAALVQSSSIDHPEILVAAFKDAAGDLTRTAIAQRHLERNRPLEALSLVQDLRFLSPAYDQAILIAALAALECGKFEKAEFYSRSIANEDTRLKIVTRIAQGNGDTGVELDALTRLYERSPQDAQIFVMLINVLRRIGQTALAFALCAEAQERFHNDPMIARIIRPILAQGPGGT